MLTLGIDQSFTSTGYFLNDEYNNTFKYGIITSDKTFNNYKRALDISGKIEDLILDLQVEKVILEGLPFMSKSNVTRDLAGLQYTIVTNLLLCGLTIGDDCIIVPPTQLKKFATGSGKASKEEMFEALPPKIKLSIGKTLKTKGRYDITDAYWLSKFNEDSLCAA